MKLNEKEIVEMQPMSHDAAATAASGTQIVADAAQGLAAGSAVSAAVTVLPAAGADEVSAQASTAFSIDAVETLSQVVAAQEELTRAGEAVIKVAGMYSAIDDGAADTVG